MGAPAAFAQGGGVPHRAGESDDTPAGMREAADRLLELLLEGGAPVTRAPRSGKRFRGDTEDERERVALGGGEPLVGSGEAHRGR